jgi:hypothetical protein
LLELGVLVNRYDRAWEVFSSWRPGTVQPRSVGSTGGEAGSQATFPLLAADPACVSLEVRDSETLEGPAIASLEIAAVVEAAAAGKELAQLLGTADLTAS